MLNRELMHVQEENKSVDEAAMHIQEEAQAILNQMISEQNK
ncbi:hypothetical protein YSY43_24650 [Paenibacillus sp. YSY-4.3]